MIWEALIVRFGSFLVGEEAAVRLKEACGICVRCEKGVVPGVIGRKTVVRSACISEDKERHMQTFF